MKVQEWGREQSEGIERIKREREGEKGLHTKQKRREYGGKKGQENLERKKCFIFSFLCSTSAEINKKREGYIIWLHRYPSIFMSTTRKEIKITKSEMLHNQRRHMEDLRKKKKIKVDESR